MFETLGHVRNHDKMYPKLSQTSFGGIVYSWEIILGHYAGLYLGKQCRWQDDMVSVVIYGGSY